MTDIEIRRLGALEIGSAIKEGKITSVQAVKAFLDAIEALDGDYRTYITVVRDEALSKAAKADEAIKAGTLTGPLAGVPIAVKDNICTKGIKTTCASRMLENFIPPYDAEVIRKVEEAGMIIIGKTNMDEFAMGSTTETSYFGITSNPWDTDRVPGGSSGGSAACVAAALAPVALGSDTGGSIRQPASFCGVTGIKPTYGRVSRYGLIAYGSSLDQIGPIGRKAEDIAALYNVISGKDQKDQSSLETEKIDLDAVADFSLEGKTFGIPEDVKGMKIGVPRDYFLEGINEEVKDAVLAAAEVLKSKGAIVEEFDLGMVEYAIPAYYVIACAEASSNLERFDGVKYGYRTGEYTDLHNMYKKTRSEGFGTEVKRRIMLGSFVLSSGYYDAYYVKALKVKALIKQAFDKAFEKYDVILGPVAPTTALKCGESLPDPIKMYLGDIYTVSVNLAGLPGISLPCGEDKEGLPIGLQLLGQTFAEKKIIQTAYTYEKYRLQNMNLRCDKNASGKEA